MEMQPNQPDEFQVRSLYNKLLDSWNKHNAEDFGQLFCNDGNTIGFDGSQMNGRSQIINDISRVFADHKVSSYVGIIREVRALSSEVFILRAVAGMVPPGQSTINRDVNAIQTLIVIKEGKKFSIACFQNTPAAFHGRPELGQQLTDELQRVLKNQKKQH